MKIFSLILLFALVGCGDTPSDKKAILGDVVPFEPQPLSSEDQGKINLICNAVNYKSSILENETRDFLFKYTERPCGQEKDTTSAVTAKIVDSRNSRGEDIYSFQPAGSKSYVFKEIETAQTGIVRKLCEAMQDPSQTITNPMRTDSTDTKAIWYQLVSTDDCEADANHLCLQILYGSSSDAGASYLRHTREQMRIRYTANVNRGYYVYRSKVSEIGCEENQVATFSTKLN